MAYLERDTALGRVAPRIHRQEVETVHLEVGLVCRARLISAAHVEYVAPHILLHGIPWTAAETQSVPLPYGVEPQSPVLSYLPARLQFEHVTGILAQITPYVVVVVYLPQEADTL